MVEENRDSLKEETSDMLEVEPQDHEFIDFLDNRLLQLEKIDPGKLPQIKGQVIVEILREKKRREEEGISALTREDIKGFYQYCPRALEQTGGVPMYIDFEISRYAGVYTEEMVPKIESLVNSVYTNFKGEMNKFIEEHGEEIENILEKKGNLVFVCTHPSWYSLFLPYFVTAAINKKFINKGQLSISLAPGPLMTQFEVLGHKINPRDILIALGINILITMPPDKDAYEKDEDVRSLGNGIRKAHLKDFFAEKVRMTEEGARMLCIAPASKQTEKKDGKDMIKPMIPATESVLKSAAKEKNTHFIVFGIKEEEVKMETDLRTVELRAKIIKNEELEEMPKKNGQFGRALDQEMANLVDGHVQESPQQSNDISQ